MTKDTHLEDLDPYRSQVQQLVALQQKDPEAAFRELTKVASRSITDMLVLGRAFEKGLGTPVDLEEAKGWYARAGAKGAARGFFYLGNLYLGTKDYVQAPSGVCGRRRARPRTVMRCVAESG